MRAIKQIILLLFVLSLTTCQDDNNIPINESSVPEETNTFLENFGETTQARFIGAVVNEQNNPIAGATISIGSAITTTDSNGIFSITEATVYERFAYIKASKAGFIDGSRALSPTSGVNQVKIMLLSAQPTATITSGQSITVDLPDGTEVDFSGDFETVFGAAYQGQVDVIVKSLNVDDDNMELMMPGNLIAENTDGDIQTLESYGMIAVELRGENGEELNINQDNPATIRIPVGNDVTNAPTTIPLWYFDEENGYWKEEGFATLEGSRYVGEVNHFSFWNCDASFANVQFCATIVDENNNPVPNILVQIEREITGWNSVSYGYTDGNGLVCGLVPSGENLTLNILGNECVDDDFQTVIGPYDTDQDITITYITASALSISLTAILNDCDGNPITNGYAQLSFDNDSQIIPILDGTLSQTLHACNLGTEFSIQVIDLANDQSSDVVIGNFTTPVTDIGTQMSCVDLTDTDGDGVLDIDEDLNGNNNLDDDDTDQDGIPNYQDEDDDGDGINTVAEDYDNDGNPMNEDSDNDGIPDYLDAQDVIDFGSEIFALNCDFNNLEYDLTETYGQTYPNTTFTYHETQVDADANMNPIANPANYVNSMNLQEIYVRVTNTISNQSSVGFLYLLGASSTDSDNDGLTDCEELTGVDNGFGNCNPNGNITDPNNPDSDGDGFNDCVEGNAGTDPNDVNSFPANSNPIAINDIATITLNNSIVYILNNDYDTNIDGTIDINTVDLDPNTLGQQSTFTVLGEGVYNIVTLGTAASVVSFQAEPTFVGTATPITYTVNDNDGNVSNEATVTITYQ